MEIDRRPAFWKLDLLCQGLRLHESCRTTEDGGRPVMRTRAGLGSGLELVLPGGVAVNAPVEEPFARASPYELRREPGGRESERYRLHRSGEPLGTVRLAPRPSWYDHETSRGRPMRRIGTLQGTVLSIYAARTCDFWRPGPGRPARESCRFCSLGLNLGADDAPDKTVEEVVEVARAAKRESRVTYVDFNVGEDDTGRYLERLEPFVRAVKDATGCLVGVQTPPLPDPADYARLRRIGTNRVSFCFEVFDEVVFRSLCPGKARVHGHAAYLDAVERALEARAAGPRLEPWVVNGEVIAGLEPPGSTIAAIEWLTARGAIPTVCVFRPLVGTELAARPPPRTEDMLPVFEALYLRCVEARLPIGLAPNIRVSLVLLPEECRDLVRDPGALAPLAGRERSLTWKRRVFRTAWALRRALGA